MKKVYLTNKALTRWKDCFLETAFAASGKPQPILLWKSWFSCMLYSLISKRDQEEILDSIVLVYVKAVVLLNSSLCVKWDCKMCLAV